MLLQEANVTKALPKIAAILKNEIFFPWVIEHPPICFRVAATLQRFVKLCLFQWLHFVRVIRFCESHLCSSYLTKRPATVIMLDLLNLWTPFIGSDTIMLSWKNRSPFVILQTCLTSVRSTILSGFLTLVIQSHPFVDSLKTELPYKYGTLA